MSQKLKKETKKRTKSVQTHSIGKSLKIQSFFTWRTKGIEMKTSYKNPNQNTGKPCFITMLSIRTPIDTKKACSNRRKKKVGFNIATSISLLIMVN